MNKYLIAALSALLVVACGKSGEAPAPAPAKDMPKTLVSGVETGNFDKSVPAPNDFYRHVNGTWLANTKIPADKSNYGSFTELADAAEQHLREIIEQAASKTDKKPGSDEQKVGDIYASFMNEDKLEELGIKPIAPQLAMIDALKSKNELPVLMAKLGMIGVTTPAAGYVNQDAKDSTQYIFYLAQSGLGLPDRDYYLSDDAKFAKIREAYVKHVATMLELAGEKDAATKAKNIMALETALAQKQWTRVESRDDEKTYNKFQTAELNGLTPGFDFNAYLNELGIGSDAVIVMQPSAYQGFAEQLKTQPLATWQAYLKWQTVSAYAPYLSKDFTDQAFAFYGNSLRGIEENRPRWKRGVEVVENALGEVLGRIYVEQYFPPEAKARMEKLVDNLKLAYRQSINDLDWMSAETKVKALEKLSKFTTKIGYPDKWKDYSALTIDKDDLVGNLMRSSTVEFKRQIAKLGKPIDRKEWFMTPQTVNAYYNPGMNEIVFPAAILQPPFFNFEADDAVNYGAIGGVIGHEIGHGFDDQGSKYDGDGNLKSWWTDEDRKRFEERTQALIEQYNHYCPLENQCVNGALTIGENIGDLGGVSIAYKAYHLALGDTPAPEMDGFTGDQRFFIGWAQVWRRLYREEELLNRLKTDPHSPSEYRTNGIVRNVPAWYSAFDVPPDSALYLAPDERVKIW